MLVTVEICNETAEKEFMEFVRKTGANVLNCKCEAWPKESAKTAFQGDARKPGNNPGQPDLLWNAEEQ